MTRVVRVGVDIRLSEIRKFSGEWAKIPQGSLHGGTWDDAILAKHVLRTCTALYRWAFAWLAVVCRSGKVLSLHIS